MASAMARTVGESARLEASPLRAEATTITTTKSTLETLLDNVFSSSANLIKLLPTTTVLIFQVLSPTLTNGGTCYTSNKYLTGFLLGLCAFLSAFSCFTDSYRTSSGTLYYGIATATGLWTLNSQINKTVNLSSYNLTVLDFVHSALTVVVFGAVALMNSNIVNCYYSDVRADAKQLVTNLPLVAGFVGSALFLVFPTTRHGIGYASSTTTTTTT